MCIFLAEFFVFLFFYLNFFAVAVGFVVTCVMCEGVTVDTSGSICDL